MSRKPPKTAAPQRLRTLGIFTVAVLKSWAGLPAQLVASFLARQDALDGAIKGRDEAGVRRVEAHARCTVHKQAVVEVIQRVANEAKIACGTDAHGPLRALLFPRGLAGFTRMTPVKLLARVKKDLLPMLLQGSVPPSVAALAAALEPPVADLEASVQAFHACEDELDSRTLFLKNERRLWLESYDQLFYGLRSHFSSRPTLAGTFFLNATGSRREEEEEDEDSVEADAPTSGNGTEPVATAPAAGAVPATTTA